MASHDARCGAISPVAFHILLSLADDDRHGLESWMTSSVGRRAL